MYQHHSVAKSNRDSAFEKPSKLGVLSCYLRHSCCGIPTIFIYKVDLCFTPFKLFTVVQALTTESSIVNLVKSSQEFSFHYSHSLLLIDIVNFQVFRPVRDYCFIL